MAQDITQKQSQFVARYSGAVSELLNATNKLADLKAEWDAQGYATGASQVQGVTWSIPDSVVQQAIPAATAAMLNSAVGAVESVRTVVAANTGYLYPLKP